MRIQILPEPPKDYNQQYMQQLIRALTHHLVDDANPGDVSCTTLVISMVPGSGAGLIPGSVWSNNGVLCVVLPTNGYAGGVSGTSKLGTVTVVTHP